MQSCQAGGFMRSSLCTLCHGLAGLVKIWIAFIVVVSGLFLNNTASVASEIIRKKIIVTPDKIELLDNYFKEGMVKLKVPGVTVGIVEKGKTVYLRSFGKVAVNGSEIDGTTAFKLGSVSKTFTALAVMKLHEVGELNINDPVVTYIPWFRTKEKSSSDQITIKQLLNHTSGLSKIAGNRNQDNLELSVVAMENSIRELRNYKLGSNPGDSFEYSNANYQILGFLIQKISKKSLAQFIRENIFEPLEMNDSFFQEEKRHLPKSAKGHLYWLGQLEEQKDMLGPVTTAQGGVYSTAEDMLLYLRMMLSQQDRIVSNASKERMLIPDAIYDSYGYGLGWYYDQFESYSLNSHFGQSRGFEAVVAFSKELELGWFVAVNSSTSFGEIAIVPFIGQVGPILNGKTAQIYGPPSIEKVLFWSILMIPIFIVLLSWRLIVKFKKNKRYLNYREMNRVQLCFKIVLPFVVVLIIPWILLEQLPNSYGAPLSAVKFFQPTIYIMIIVATMSLLIWMLLRVALMIFSSKKV